MRLGNYVHISLSVPVLRDSLPFYEKLGFRKLWSSMEPNPWVLLTDGALNLHLYEYVFPSPTLNYFAADMEERVIQLRRKGLKITREMNKDESLVEDSFYDPNDQRFVLTHHAHTEMPKPQGLSFSRCGTFGELTIMTDDLEGSIAFWEQVFFTRVYESSSPYPWAIMTDELMTIGLHARKGLARTAISYFAPDMPDHITRLRRDGLELEGEFKDEAGRTVASILEAPDSQLFFLFTGEP